MRRLQAGESLVVFDRDENAVKAVEVLGAQGASSTAEVDLSGSQLWESLCSSYLFEYLKNMDDLSGNVLKHESFRIFRCPGTFAGLHKTRLKPHLQHNWSWFDLKPLKPTHFLWGYQWVANVATWPQVGRSCSVVFSALPDDRILRLVTEELLPALQSRGQGMAREWFLLVPQVLTLSRTYMSLVWFWYMFWLVLCISWFKIKHAFVITYRYIQVLLCIIALVALWGRYTISHSYTSEYLQANRICRCIVWYSVCFYGPLFIAFCY